MMQSMETINFILESVILMKAKTIKISDISKWLNKYERKFYKESEGKNV